MVHFISCRLEKPEGAKTISVSFRTLGKLLNSSHITVAMIAKEWEKYDLAQLSSKTIYIPDMAKLYSAVMGEEKE